MSLRQLMTGMVLLGVLTVWTKETFGQAESTRDAFAIKDIRQQQVDAPTYGGADGLGGRPASLQRKWLKIEVQFDSRPEWADDVQVKYYVLMKYQAKERMEEKLFVGEVAHINVAKGSQHYSAMFIPPNALKRYGGGQAEVVTARIFYNGALVSTKTEAPGKAVPASWWEKYPPVLGCLLAPQDTPWEPVAGERFEAIKPTTR
ncbi:MAG: hypothetical protein WCG79_00670 [Verrucomicrobiota bacterium]